MQIADELAGDVVTAKVHDRKTGREARVCEQVVGGPGGAEIDAVRIRRAHRDSAGGVTAQVAGVTDTHCQADLFVGTVLRACRAPHRRERDQRDRENYTAKIAPFFD